MKYTQKFMSLQLTKVQFLQREIELYALDISIAIRQEVIINE